MDESAYLSQTAYADLYWTGKWNHPAWLDYAAYDLPPLPKYLIGGALWLEGYRRPDLSSVAIWYGSGRKDEFAGTGLLVAGRRPAVVLGAVGCLAMFWLGTLIGGEVTGWSAAVLLALDPLYRMHARRAMSDVPAEAFMLLALLLGLIGWRRASRGATTGRLGPPVVLAAFLVGLATLAKLNGVLAGVVLAGWVALALVSRAFPARARWILGLSAPIAAVAAFVTFVTLNPYLTTRPARPLPPGVATEAAKSFLARVGTVYAHRAAVSRAGMAMFSHNALPSLADRLAVVAVQGFGRFGPLGPSGGTDSTVRFDWRQDRGALIWGPLVAVGSIVLAARGRSEFQAGLPPLSWLPLTYFLVVVGVVTPFIPLAWDRYFLSIQAPAALVVASLIGVVARRVPVPSPFKANG